MKLIVVTSNYPDENSLYSNSFIHLRAKEYTKKAEVKVVGYDSNNPSIHHFTNEGIEAVITNNFDEFIKEINAFGPDAICVHFADRSYIDILLHTNWPLVVFVHGYEALSWKRRLINYTRPGDFPYLVRYLVENQKQMKSIKKLALSALNGSLIHFVFVSKWLKEAVQKDWRMPIEGSIIPNGIDTDLFGYLPKSTDSRRKFLIIRSFNARSYANDISVEAILLLSKKKFFHELEFTIYGEGYLFEKLMPKIKHLANVKVFNTYIENRQIPSIHAAHGIFLCPSRFDTQGVLMCEAMSSGLVPIASPVGGIPEYVEDGNSGFLINTSHEMVARIEQLYFDPDLFLKMSINARQAIESRCSIKNTVSMEMNVIEAILELN